MKNSIQRLLACGFLVLSTGALLRADRAADRRNEIIPPGLVMHSPIHRATNPSDSSSPTGNGYTPQQLRHAYGFDQLGTTGQGQIIAIVDAYGSPTMQADLNTFCTAFGLPSTTVQVYYPQGQPSVDSGWALETSLDVEWAHAIAPGATIVLVAAQSSSGNDLYAAVDYAVSLGATQVSMSWGGSEYTTEGTSDFHFNVPGVTFIASSGDYGGILEYPACTPSVVGVGGTTLKLDSSGNYISESAWSGGGGGPSVFETVDSYQIGWWNGATRAVPDVSYDADPNTGVPVYLTGNGWIQVGGTSMGAPQWAAFFALANSLSSQPISSAPAILYSLATSPTSPNYATYFHDITSGSNGHPAGPGYDLATGLGTPIANQLVLALAGGFSAQVAAPAFLPPAGVYASGSVQIVSILSATPGASIRYTIDGSTPTETNGALYSGPVSISANTALKAVAYKSGLADSPVTSGSYTFLPQVAAPVFSPAAGTYSIGQNVAITTATNDALIRYTTDGSTPTETYGALYSGPLNITCTTTLTAIAYRNGFTDSTTTVGNYTLADMVVLYNFSTAPAGTGWGAAGTLAQGSDGNFYGTTVQGGSNALDGSVYKVTPAGVLSTLFSFDGRNNGQYPEAGLVQGGDGNFYGTTSQGGSGGAGTVFKITPTGSLTTLYTFDGGANGGWPYSTLVQGSDGNLYGATSAGGSGGEGTVFRMTAAGALTTLVSFNTGNGSGPSGLVQGSDGNFYGTTGGGGSMGYGTAFKMTPAGALTTLLSFDYSNGGGPNGNLVQGSDGNFYGTTDYGGGGAGYGTVFKMTPAGVLTTLDSFNGPNGANPAVGLAQGSDGSFYGTTIAGGGGYGTAFRVTPTGALTTLVSFNNTNGANPYAGLVQGSDGNFYGVTYDWNNFTGGVIFRLTVPPQVDAPVFSPAAGAYTDAQTVTISTTTGGASIRYTTDGSTPTETNGALYTGPVSIGVTTTLYAVAFETGFTDSAVTSGVYTIGLPAAAPFFSPAAGTYTSAQAVMITSATSGASIAYTTDGSTPTEVGGTVTHGTLLSNGGTVSMGATATLNAMAFANGFADSPVATAAYTITPQAAAPTFSPVAGTYTSAQTVTITSTTSGASIRYTTDGSTPTEASGTPYAGPVGISTTTALNAIAYEAGYTDSPVTSGIYTIGTSPPPQVAAPVFGPAAGTFSSAQNVTITSATFGATIRYTIDGSIPTETNGMLYVGSLSISDTTTLQAIAYEAGFTDSAVTNGLYTIPQAAAPVFSPLAGVYSSAQTVTITTTTSGASIRYTTDGSTPTETSGTLYSVPVSISSNTVLTAIAYGSGLADSPAANGAYTIVSPVASVNVLYNFSAANNGGFYPYAGLVQGGDGNFYGTTADGGSEGYGTIFKLTPAGTLTLLASFYGANGANPYAGLVQGSDGNFYGTTYGGGRWGYGTVFKLTPAGLLTTLASFDGTDGDSPQAALVQGSDGNFYGTTSGQGSGGDGTVFKITPAGVLTTLVSFDDADGETPLAPLVQGSDGNFYGTTSDFGVGYGTIFKMTPAGVLTTLYSFDGDATNGDTPMGGLVQGRDGNFYGTTSGLDGYYSGTVFKITPAGVLTTLFSFDAVNDPADGAWPQAGLVQGSDGNFYGTTSEYYGGYGTVFKLTPAGALTTLASFDGANGYYPIVDLVQGQDGSLYGTTVGGGAANDGVVFQLIVPPQTGAPVFTPAAGTYSGAQTVTITSATSGVTIRYTTDGSTPTETDGALYSGPVGISNSTALNAIAYGGTSSDSAVTSGIYIIGNSPPPQVAAPVFSPASGTYADVEPTVVAITSATFGATIRYTTDGSTPTETNGAIYQYPLTFYDPSVSDGGTITLKAIAYETGFSDSPMTGGIYTFLPEAAEPTFNPTNGTYTSIQSVSISSATSSASIVYTTDGSFPTESGGTVTHGTLLPNGGTVSVGRSLSIEAIAFASGYIDSFGAAVSNYTINLPQAATPTFSPGGGTYTSAQSVAISTTTSGASIAYTTDGSAPTESGGSVTHGTLLSNGGSVLVNATTTLKVIAFEYNYTDSPVASGVYTINISAPIPTTLRIQGSDGER
jgi:uncharacterized repeat protein (TIGR03803 family)